MTVLSFANTLFLTLDSSLSAQIWQASHHHHPRSTWRAYLNQLCLDGALPWLQDEFEVAAARLKLEERSRRAIWDTVGGSAVSIGEDARLVLIPSEATDLSELRVPQEWVDIPSWVSDYYVGVQVNPDDHQLCVWGYTTHAHLKQYGRYDPADRTYAADGEALADLAALSVARSLCPEEPTRLSVSSLPELPLAQAETLIQRLSRLDCLTPRLEVPFSTWGALLENPNWRSQLYEARRGIPQSQQRSSTDLGQWLRSVGQADLPGWMEQGWQALEALLSPTSTAAMAFRQYEQPRGIFRGKRLALDTETGPVTVILLVTVEAEADGRVSIRIQLRPEVGATLPSGVEMSLLAPSGEVIQTVSSRAADDYVQLKRFRLPPGYPFTVQIRLEAATVLEPFTT